MKALFEMMSVPFLSVDAVRNSMGWSFKKVPCVLQVCLHFLVGRGGGGFSLF